MPWSAEDAHRHKKGLTPEQAKKWAKAANAALQQYGEEGRAVRVANAAVSKALKSDRERYVEVFAKALDEGFTDERAHRIAWTAITKHLPGKHNQKDHGSRKSIKTRAKSGAKRAVSAEGRAAVLGAAAKVMGSSIYSSKSIGSAVERLMWTIKLESMAEKERAKIKKAAGDPAEQLAGFLDDAKVETDEDVRRVLDAHRDLVLQAIAEEEEGEGVSKHGTHNQNDHGKRGGTSKSSGSSSGGSSGGRAKAAAKTGTFGSGKDQGKGLDLSSGAARRKQRGKKVAMETARGLGRAAITTAVLSAAIAAAAGVAFKGGTFASNAKELVGKRSDGIATPKMIYKGIQKIAAKRGIDEGEATKLLLAALKKQGKGAVAKAEEEASTYVEFAKVDPDKQQVFGWAIVAKDAEGNDVIDLQGDLVSPDEVEKAAYDYVIHSRDGGEMHVRKGVSRMIESMVVSPDKLQAMGVISKGETGIPMGWWVGFEITDEGVWKSVKDGRYTGFSIHGLGKRQPIGKREDFEKRQRLIAKAHDELGRAVMRGDNESVLALAEALQKVS